MSTPMDIEFLDTLGRQIESIDETRSHGALARRHLLTIVAATLALGIAVLGAVGGWSRWIADETGGAGGPPSGGGQSGQGPVPIPSPANWYRGPAGLLRTYPTSPFSPASPQTPRAASG